ncbi:MAG TPA: hypothetical protein VGU43_07470 [Thermoplasmata archaeon]|nr:hypothetical protein [Thermoplasmata archaeon]
MSDVRAFLLDLVGLVNDGAAEPAVSIRLAGMPAHRVAVCVYESDCHLRSQLVNGTRVVQPDAELTRGQTTYLFVAELGHGLRITPVGEVPEDVDSVVYVSAPALGALTNGYVEGPGGAREPFDAMIALRDGHLAFVGPDPAALLGLTSAFRDVVDRTRSHLRSAAPEFRGGITSELAAEREAVGGFQIGISDEEMAADLARIGASPEEIAASLEEWHAQLRAARSPRITLPAGEAETH